MSYHLLRSAARLVTGPIVLSLLATCLPQAEASLETRWLSAAKPRIETTGPMEHDRGFGTPDKGVRATQPPGAPDKGGRATQPPRVRSVAARRDPRSVRHYLPGGLAAGRFRVRGGTPPPPPPHQPSLAPTPGLTYPWEGSFAGVNTGGDNVLTRTDPLSHETEFTYSSANDLLTVTTPMGKQVVNTWDGDGNLTKVELKDSGGVVRSTTDYTWDAYGSLVTRTDDNDNQTSYEHDSNGHLTKVTTPNGRETEFAVNGLGVRTSRTDAMDRTTSYTLDNWLRVTGIDYPTGTDPSFSYDAENRLTGWTDGVGTWARTYDDAGRITAETLGGNTRVGYSWDATGKKGLLSSITDADSRTITYSYTSRNQLYQVGETAGTATYSYNANGQETALTNQNGTTVAKAYDDAGRLTSVTNRNSSNTVLSSFAYTLNDDDMRTYVEEADNSTVTFSYNGIGRLTGETRTGTNAFTAAYTLDGEGNRTSQTVDSTTTSFTLNDDYELTATSGGFANNYSYNANGEQTGRTLGGTAYTLAFDYEGQLTQITQGQNTTDFVYDALGRRYSRASGGTTTVYYYAGSAILQEKQGGTFTAAYTYGNALLRRNSEYPLYDGHGSERTVTASNQSVTGTINFEAFGQTVGTSGSSSSPYMYAGAWGYRTDGDAGLMHVGARYYDAQVGRFITRDTVLSEHPYLYCEHDAVNGVDPSGHQAAAAAIDYIRIGAPIAGACISSGPPGWVVGGVLVVGGALAAGVWWYVNRPPRRPHRPGPRRPSVTAPRPYTAPERPFDPGGSGWGSDPGPDAPWPLWFWWLVFKLVSENMGPNLGTTSLSSLGQCRIGSAGSWRVRIGVAQCQRC